MLQLGDLMQQNNKNYLILDSNKTFIILQEGQKIRDAIVDTFLRMFRSGRGVSQVTDYGEATSPLL